MPLDTLDGQMSRTVMMTITLKMMRAKANRGSEQNRTEMKGSAEKGGRKKPKKTKGRAMLSNKKLVLDDGQKKQWQPQRQVHVEKNKNNLCC